MLFRFRSPSGEGGGGSPEGLRGRAGAPAMLDIQVATIIRILADGTGEAAAPAGAARVDAGRVRPGSPALTRRPSSAVVSTRLPRGGWSQGSASPLRSRFYEKTRGRREKENTRARNAS